MIATSKWQILGYNTTEGWAVTFFEKTLFTPAGLDVYVRDGFELKKEIIDGILEKMKGVEGDVGVLAKGLFEVKRSD